MPSVRRKLTPVSLYSSYGVVLVFTIRTKYITEYKILGINISRYISGLINEKRKSINSCIGLESRIYIDFGSSFKSPIALNNALAGSNFTMRWM